MFTNSQWAKAAEEHDRQDKRSQCEKWAFWASIQIGNFVALIFDKKWYVDGIQVELVVNIDQKLWKLGASLWARVSLSFASVALVFTTLTWLVGRSVGDGLN